MKKLIAMLLVLVMVMSLVACGNQNDVEVIEPDVTDPVVTDPVVEEPETEATEPEAEAPAIENGALEVLNKIWNVTGENEKFPAMGGDANNPVDGAPGVYSLGDTEMLTYQLLVPAEQTANIDEAAALFHGMMLNNFTCGVYHVTGDAEAFADAMYDAIKNNQWMCGFPDSMVIAMIGEGYVLAAFGIDDIMKPFVANMREAHNDIGVLYLEAVE